MTLKASSNDPRELPPSASRRIMALVQASNELRSVAQRLSSNYEVRDIRLAESGLYQLPLQESVLGQYFYLGEIPMSVCEVELRTASGACYRGAAFIMADDPALAWSLAVLEGIHSHRLAGWDEVHSLIGIGEERLRREDSVRKRMLAQTKVNFSPLSHFEAGGSDE